MKIGNYDCYCLEMGKFLLDGGAMFGMIPKVLWEQKIPADVNNRIPMSTKSLLLISNQNKILVDLGIGNVLSQKEEKIYAFSSGLDTVNEKLQEYNLTIEDITDVFITHMHFDHVGGATIKKNGSRVPFYPKATYHIQKNHFKEVLSPNVREKTSFILENILPLKECKVLNLCDENEKIFDGIDIFVSHGHTKAQQHLLVHDKKNPMFTCADLIPTSAHIPLAWGMGFDNFPLTVIKEKESVLERAVKENWILSFIHDPDIAAVTVKKSDKNRIKIDKRIENLS